MVLSMLSTARLSNFKSSKQHTESENLELASHRESEECDVTSSAASLSTTLDVSRKVSSEEKKVVSSPATQFVSSHLMSHSPLLC